MPPHSQSSTSPDTSEQPEEEECVYEAEDPAEDEYYARQQQQQHQQYSNSSIGRSSPWSSGNEWRQGYTGNNGGGNAAIDDVQRALSTLELASNQSTVSNLQQGGYGNYQHTGQTTHPPRFNPNQGTQPQHHSTGLRGNGADGGYNGNNNSAGNGHRVPPGNDFDGRQTPLSQSQRGYTQQQQYGQQRDERDQGLRGRSSIPNMQYGYQQSGGGHIKSGSASSSNAGAQPESVPGVPPIPLQYLQQQTGQGTQGGRPGLGVATTFTTSNAPVPSGQTPVQPFANTPIDVPSLIATKGYNPATFDTRPQFARFFVIKSYTEDDVHKSLKYEIWSSTDPGNKRLDKAFKDTAGRGPIYLFFSVNASGHFCGMAEMLTPVSCSLYFGK